MNINHEDRARRIVADLKGTWRGHHALCCCPAHNDRTPSLSVTVGHSAVLFKCFAGCTSEEILAALKQNRIGKSTSQPHSDWNIGPIGPRRDFRDLAFSIWEKAKPVSGTLAQTYLESRALIDMPPFGRFIPRTLTIENRVRLWLPALLLPIANNNGLLAIQRIFLDPQTGAKASIDFPKKTLGVPENGAIRYGAIADDGHLNLAEGFEDAASVRLMLNLPNCWAACGIERYQQLSIPREVKHITIWTQHGSEAARCVEGAREHLTANNRTLSIEPPPSDMDWNDLLRSKGLPS